jgi:hypothetical protein
MVLVVKPEGNRHLEDIDVNRRVIFKMCLTEIMLKDVNCICLAQDRVFVKMVMNLQVI